MNLREISTKSSFKKSKKAVSSLFMTVFIALIIVMLIAVLFFGITVSNSGISQYLKADQNKMQESIQLYQIEANESNFITSVSLINSGSIVVRLRALYIGGDLICDPSDSSVLGERAYVEPKENVSIPLASYGLALAPRLNVLWTATTERGTKSTQKGIDLWLTDDRSVYTPDKYYFGPIMLYFSSFQYRSGNGPWLDGWEVSKQTTEVMWKIKVQNVDDRVITLSEDSSFSLVGNTNIAQQQVWYIDPASSDMVLTPLIDGYIVYKWNKPVSAGGASTQKIGEFSEDISCKNFLVFTGNFTEPNGSYSPFGQTIPFEAVLITG